jgi:hypothetical protein
MRYLCLSLLIGMNSIVAARADVTLVQNVEGLGSASQVTIKIKGNKVRIDASPKLTTIFDGTTGEMINLIREDKTVVRLSADKLKAAAQMINKFSSQQETAEKPKLAATGKKENINGHETEQYVYDGPDFKAVYWIAPKYPNGADILKQLQAVKSEAWNAAGMNWPDYRDFPGIPLRTRLTTKNPAAHGGEITTTIASVKQDSLSDSEFAVPPDFKEVKVPDIFGGKELAPSVSPAP